MIPLVVDVDQETLHDMELCAGFSPIGSSVYGDRIGDGTWASLQPHERCATEYCHNLLPLNPEPVVLVRYITLRNLSLGRESLALFTRKRAADGSDYYRGETGPYRCALTHAQAAARAEQSPGLPLFVWKVRAPQPHPRPLLLEP
jgi:hypothetical protein